MSADNTRFVIDGVEYTWFGGFGNIMSSQERGMKRNELRAINGHILRVFSVEGSKVCWTTVGSVEYDWIRKFKQELLGN